MVDNTMGFAPATMMRASRLMFPTIAQRKAQMIKVTGEAFYGDS